MPDHAPRVGVVGVPGGWSSENLADAVAERTGTRLLIDMREVSLDTATGTVAFRGEDLSRLDGIILKKVGSVYGPSMLDRLELLRHVSRTVPTFSRPSRVLRLVDRLSCTVALCGAGIPMPATVLTEDVDKAAEAVLRFERAVIKPLYSTKARGMCVIDVAESPDPRADIADFKDAGNPVLYVQQMVDLPGQDLGVAFLAGEHIGTYARVRADNAWSTTTKSGGRYQAHDVSPELVELARRAQEPFGLDFTVVDIAETESGPVVFEVSAFGGFRGLSTALGLDPAALYADHVLSEIQKRR